MKFRISNFWHKTAFVFLFVLVGFVSKAQDTAGYKRNAISCDIVSLSINEVNLSIEHYISPRRSIEITGGIIYVNDYIENLSKDWLNADLFSEHGYSGRLHFKFYKRQEDNSKWQDYISPGLVFKHLYYNDQIVVTDPKTDYSHKQTLTYHENLLQKRDRNILGLEFLFGKVYGFNRTFIFEFYYGAGIMFTMATRTDHSRYAVYDPSHDSNGRVTDENQWRNHYIPDYIDHTFYARPEFQIGVKLKLRM